MGLLSPRWRCIILLLCVSFHRCPLLLAGCADWRSSGYLTVKPAKLFLLGSNLTVYCHTTNGCYGAKTFLEVDGKALYTANKINCTTVMFTLVNVQTPSSVVRCKLACISYNILISGLDLNAGLPPAKPQNVRCETRRSSSLLECSWERGWETHINTNYNVSVGRENGTRILLAGTENVTIQVPCSAHDEDGKYQVNVTAYNHFGFSQSDPVSFFLKDIVIPEAPDIMQITFENSSVVALLHWNTTESLRCFTSSIRLRTGNGSWEEVEPKEPCEGQVYVHGLAPLTDYVFQMRTCHSGRKPEASCTSGSAAPPKSLCSRWSLSVAARSPGKGPSQQLLVWRIFRKLEADKLWNVTVLWKPPSPDDYSGEVQYYRIFFEHMKERNCSAALSRCTLQVPAGLPALSISAVTLYGASPPADVPLRYSGGSRTVTMEVFSADNGSSLLVSWPLLPTESGGQALHYVLEWAGVAEVEPQWERLAGDQNSTSITGTEHLPPEQSCRLRQPEWTISNNILLYFIVLEALTSEAPSRRLLARDLMSDIHIYLYIFLIYSSVF
uniref:Class I helical cytokine receptor number 24 n=1 Tax=Tetraodon nigroviridis TaxID=99883 RepID=Q6UAN2_TETNG|nr:class I helical cytokine receptor number 24 [Tetraodon nigroviridis]